MNLKQRLIALSTIVRFEMTRVFRLWKQTLLPPVVTAALYYLVFGKVIGHRVGAVHGISYIQYIAPGLIMMQVIMSAYASSVSALFISKFHKNIEEMLISPMSKTLLLLGFMSGGVLRGLLVGVLVSIVSLFFTHIHVFSIVCIVLSVILTTVVFSLAGLINAVYAKSFDDISVVPSFVLTPLTFLGGVFYSIAGLPQFWREASWANPIVYMVDTFRYGFLRVSDGHIIMSYLAIVVLMIGLSIWAFVLFNRSEDLRL